MNEPIIIGIDAGTSVIKAIAFDHGGAQLAMAATPNSYDELPGGGVEQDLARTWIDTATVLKELSGKIDNLAARTTAMAVTGQGDGTWLIDQAGEPVGKGWLWLDSRAADIVEEWEQSGVRAQAFRHTGCGLNACNQSAHLAWLDRHQPELLARAATAFHCKDWLYFKLTGQRATDSAEGVFTFGDFRNRSYVPELLDTMGIGHLQHLLPPLVDGSQTTHPLSEAAAEACGLRTGTPVSLAFLDVPCTGLGAGVWDPSASVGCSVVGSTGMHMQTALAKDIVLADKPTGYIMSFMVPGTVTRMQSNMAATLNIDWIVDRAREAAAILGQDVERMEALLALDGKVMQAEPAGALFHPYISEAGERGPFVNVTARASFNGLSTRTTFIDMVRAVYEGLALAALDCYEAMGGAPDEVRIAGGAARSAALKTIMASMLGSTIRETTREEAGAAGAAMMAAVATGVFASMGDAVESWVLPNLAGRVEPDPQLSRRYQELYPIYRDISRTMPPAWQAMSNYRRSMS